MKAVPRSDGMQFDVSSVKPRVASSRRGRDRLDLDRESLQTRLGYGHGRVDPRPILFLSMPNRPSARRRSPLDRAIRSRWARCVLAAVLIPILVLGVFGGTTFLAHAHDGHDAHLHASSSIEEARQSADQHRLAHALGIATCDGEHAGHDGHPNSGEVPAEPLEDPDFPAPAEDPTGLVITIPDHEQLVTRGIYLSQTLQTAQVLCSALAWCWARPHGEQDEGSPGGSMARGPLHLSALSAGQRLVRTSNALLI